MDLGRLRLARTRPDQSGHIPRPVETDGRSNARSPHSISKTLPGMGRPKRRNATVSLRHPLLVGDDCGLLLAATRVVHADFPALAGRPL